MSAETKVTTVILAENVTTLRLKQPTAHLLGRASSHTSVCTSHSNTTTIAAKVHRISIPVLRYNKFLEGAGATARPTVTTRASGEQASGVSDRAPSQRGEDRPSTAPRAQAQRLRDEPVLVRVLLDAAPHPAPSARRVQMRTKEAVGDGNGRTDTHRFSVDLPAPCPAFLSMRMMSGCGLPAFRCCSVAACLNECSGTTRSSSAHNRKWRSQQGPHNSEGEDARSAVVSINGGSTLSVGMLCNGEIG